MPVQDVQVRLCASYLLVFLVDSLIVFQGGKLKTQTLATYIDHQSCTCMIPPHFLWFPLFPEIFKGFSYVLEVSMVITANSVIHWMPRRMDGGWAVQLAMLQRSSAQRSMAVHWIPCESLRKVDGTRSCLWMFVGTLFIFCVCNRQWHCFLERWWTIVSHEPVKCERDPIQRRWLHSIHRESIGASAAMAQKSPSGGFNIDVSCAVLFREWHENMLIFWCIWWFDMI